LHHEAKRSGGAAGPGLPDAGSVARDLVFIA
jgi:hypothetical protein